MSLPVAQYKALLIQVRNIRRKAQHVRQLATPLINTNQQIQMHSLNNNYTMDETFLIDDDQENFEQCDDSDENAMYLEVGPENTSILKSLETQSDQNTEFYKDAVNMWKLTPKTSIIAGSHENTGSNSVMSFASSSGGITLERPMCSPTLFHRSSQQLEAKVDMVYSLLSMLSGQENTDMGETLLMLSSSPDSCLAMRQSGCIPLLVQLVQSDRDPETRAKASRALQNLVHSQNDEKLRKREIRIYKLLEQIRQHIEYYPKQCRNEQILSKNGDNNTEGAGDNEDGQCTAHTVAHLMKLSFDEGHRQAICLLGGIYTLAKLIEVAHNTDQDASCNNSNGDLVIMRRYACMALTNLTFGDSGNKALLCSFKDFMNVLVQQLEHPSEELKQVTASVLRNLSWRPDSISKETLRVMHSVCGLTQAAMATTKETTRKSMLSALWNLSSHCSDNKSEICNVDGALGFLVEMLLYKSPSKSLAIVENAGGILRNCSSLIAIRDDYRQLLRQHNCLQILLDQLKSPSLTIVSNACGTLWNLSAKCQQDQNALWSMGAPAMLRSLNHSKHKLIAMGSSAALKNLLMAKPSQEIVAPLDATAAAMDLPILPTLGARKQRALLQELDVTLANDSSTDREKCLENHQVSTSTSNQQNDSVTSTSSSLPLQKFSSGTAIPVRRATLPQLRKIVTSKISSSNIDSKELEMQLSTESIDRPSLKEDTSTVDEKDRCSVENSSDSDIQKSLIIEQLSSKCDNVEVEPMNNSSTKYDNMKLIRIEDDLNQESQVEIPISNKQTARMQFNGKRISNEFDDFEGQSCESANQRRLLDPNAMIESLDRYTAELVSQSAHLQSAAHNSVSTVSNCNSTDQLTFPSLSSMSTPNVLTFSSDNDNDNGLTTSLDLQHNTKMTSSALITYEATRLAQAFEQQSCFDLDHIQPPSHLNSLIVSTASLENAGSCPVLMRSPKSLRSKRPLPAGVALMRKLHINSNTKSISQQHSNSLDSLDDPESGFGDQHSSHGLVYSSSMEHLSDGQRKSSQSSSLQINGSIQAVTMLCSTSEPRYAWMNDNIGSVTDLDQVNPPSLLLNNTFDDFLADIEVFENGQHDDDVDDNTEMASTADFTPIPSDPTTPNDSPQKKKSTVTVGEASKKISNYDNKLTPKEKRKLDPSRFETRVIDESIIGSLKQLQVSTTSPKRLFSDRRRHENPDRFLTHVVTVPKFPQPDSSFSPDEVSEASSSLSSGNYRTFNRSDARIKRQSPTVWVTETITIMKPKVTIPELTNNMAEIAPIDQTNKAIRGRRKPLYTSKPPSKSVSSKNSSPVLKKKQQEDTGKSKIPKPESKSNGQQNVIPSNIARKSIPRLRPHSVIEEASNSSKSPGLKPFNRSISADYKQSTTEQHLSRMSQSPSVQNLLKSSPQKTMISRPNSTGAIRKSSIPKVVSSNGGSHAKPIKTMKKQVTSKIANLWKRIEDSKKDELLKMDTKVWIEPQKTHQEVVYTTVKRRVKDTSLHFTGVLEEANNTKRISRLGSFILMDG